ncbi:MAG: transcriptional repressor LexA [Gammaproteobacteria bacterium]|jgi:repressor LexA|nr:transcriptional repressor LexA [Gammaproteobacteria bacterium]
MAATLTARQLEVLNFVRKTLKASGLPPTRSEIAEALGFRSANAAEEHLRALARKGAIELLPGASRGIRLPDEPETNVSGLPVVGRVAAGYPILASEHIEEHLQLDPAAFHPRADYLLRVKGASMRDAGILNDDLLAVHAVSTAENGQIVVARLEDEVTVKRFQRRGQRVSLLPENEAFTPIEVDLATQSLVIEGLVVGVLRSRVR